MEKLQLGKSDLYVNPVGLGCMGFSHAYGDPTDGDVAIRLLREAHEIGYDFYDTAECYIGVKADGSISYNEELVGEALRGVRDEVVIATKMGVHHDANNPRRFARAARGRSAGWASTASTCTTSTASTPKSSPKWLPRHHRRAHPRGQGPRLGHLRDDRGVPASRPCRDTGHCHREPLLHDGAPA